jgi:hypothetical protein
MALNGNFVSFQSIVEAVYRRAGYQTVDWAEAIEVIAETIRLIGVLPAYKDVTTNGLSGNPIPLEVVDFRTTLPTGFVSLKGVRKIILSEVDDGNGGTELKISRFSPMIEASDMFYQSIRENWTDTIPSGQYNYVQLTQVETITLSGTDGTANITLAGGLTKLVTFDTTLTLTASNFVTDHEAAYAVENITVTSDGANLIFTSSVSGTHFTQPAIVNLTEDLTGTVVETVEQTPVKVYGQDYKINPEAQYEYKVNDGYIYTNFETGYIEAVYTGFVTDVHGFPMIPDDQRFIEAVRWSLIEHIDYKKWRVSEITDKVYYNSQKERDWYVASARNKANTPTIGEMEKMKNMFLRTIQRTDAYSNYFKYSNVPEQRYTQTGAGYYRRKY